MISSQSSAEILNTNETYVSYLEEQVLEKNLKIVQLQKENRKLLEETEFLKKEVADYGDLQAKHTVLVIQNSDMQLCLDESQKRVDALQKERSNKALADAKAAKEREAFWRSVKRFFTPQGVIEYQSTQYFSKPLYSQTGKLQPLSLAK